MKKYIICVLSILAVCYSASVFADSISQKKYKQAIISGDLELINQLFQSRKVDANKIVIDNKVYSPLAYACARRAIKISYYLISKGAYVNGRYDGYTALAWIAMKEIGNSYAEQVVKLSKYMFDKGANINDGGKWKVYPLHFAAQNNCMPLIKLFIKQGAKRSLKDWQGKTAAEYASSAGHIEVANFLRGKSNSDYKNSLFYASKIGDIEKAKRILRQAGRRAYLLVQEHEKGSGNTALHYAAKYDRVKIAKLLLKYKAPINAKSKGAFTPLHTAVSYSHSKIALMLLNHGANPNIIQSSGCAQGFTAFHWAVHRSLDKVVKKIWSKGSVNLNASKGKEGDIFYLVRSLKTLKILVNYCGLKPNSESLAWMSKTFPAWKSYLSRFYKDQVSFSASPFKKRMENHYFKNGRNRLRSGLEPQLNR